MSEILLPKSRVVTVTFLFAMPVTATKDQVMEWVAFELGHGGAMEADNPLDDFELEALGEPILEDVRKHLHETIEQTGENLYTTRRSLSPEPCWGPTGQEQMTELVMRRYKER